MATIFGLLRVIFRAHDRSSSRIVYWELGHPEGLISIIIIYKRIFVKIMRIILQIRDLRDLF